MITVWHHKDPLFLDICPKKAKADMAEGLYEKKAVLNTSCLNAAASQFVKPGERKTSRGDILQQGDKLWVVGYVGVDLVV